MILAFEYSHTCTCTRTCTRICTCTRTYTSSTPRYLHMWAWLIMDYVVKEVHEEGSGHWQCTLITNMFFCGKLRERNLTLCCIPGPIFRIFKFFFGEKT